MKKTQKTNKVKEQIPSSEIKPEIVESIFPNTATEVIKNLESCSLVVVTVGSSERPASFEDIHAVCEKAQHLFETLKNVRVFVVPHLVTVKAYKV